MFQRFGWITTVDRLAGGDATRWRNALTLSFSYAVTKLELELEREDFNKRLSAITDADNKVVK